MTSSPAQKPPPASDTGLPTLPEHSVRVSARARRISLRIVPGKGLEVVLPRQVDPAVVPDVLRRHHTWISKHLPRLAMDDGKAAASSEASDARQPLIPETLFLKGGQDIVRIISPLPRSLSMALGAAALPGNGLPPAGAAAPCARQRDIHLPSSLVALSPRDAERRARQWLRGWVRKEALDYLGGMLQALAYEHDFSYAKVAVRFQKSRWGSCSGRKNISLNASMLFLPEALARYVIVHELCHTCHMDHSERFWQRVFRIDPHAMRHDKALRFAWKYVPAWVFTE